MIVSTVATLFRQSASWQPLSPSGALPARSPLKQGADSMREMFSKAYRTAFKYVFYDEVRLFELFSAFNLLAWSVILLIQPGILNTAVYQSFSELEATVWAYCFGLIALAQIMATLIKCWHPVELRFVAMSFSSGAWTVVAWNFWQSSISTTANLNYTLLALGCAISGAFLGWKTTSYQS